MATLDRFAVGARLLRLAMLSIQIRYFLGITANVLGARDDIKQG